MDETVFMLITDRKPRYDKDRTEIGPFKTKNQAIDYQYHLPNYGAEWRIIERPISHKLEDK